MAPAGPQSEQHVEDDTNTESESQGNHEGSGICETVEAWTKVVEAGVEPPRHHEGEPEGNQQQRGSNRQSGPAAHTPQATKRGQTACFGFALLGEMSDIRLKGWLTVKLLGYEK